MRTPPLTGIPIGLQALIHGERLAHLNTLDELLELPDFAADEPLAAVEQHQRTYRRLTALMQHTGGAVSLAGDPARLHTVLEWAAVVDRSLFHAVIVHVGVCTATILELGRPGTYLSDLLGELDAQQAVGNILITELGRGNSHIAPGTQARFHPESRSFTLHTPDPASVKIMAHVAAPGIAKTALVYANLLIGERQCGVFPFVVRVRTADGPGEGVRITALPEVPAVPLDYARVSFDGTPVPYDGWLRDNAAITDSGRFTDPLPDPDQRLIRSLVFSANASMSAAVGLASAARACITAALRYAEHRTTSGRLAPGLGVLAYRTQQGALYSALAQAWATTLLVERAKSWHLDKPSAVVRSEEPTWAPWPSVHRGLALTKAGATRTLERVAATCRKRSGAQGVLLANRLVQYEGLAQIYEAAAGDNQLIRMDAGKTLAQDGDYRPRSRHEHAPLDPEDAGSIRALAVAREAGLLATLRERIAAHSSTDTPFETWNPLMPQAMELADAHLLSTTLEVFDDAIHTLAGSDAAISLRALQTLYGLDTLKENLAWHLEHGTLTPADASRVHAAREAAVERVHHHAPVLIEAFAVPPARLRSPMAEPDYTTAFGTLHPAKGRKHTEPSTPRSAKKETAMPSSTSLFSLEGKNALVTGASRGFGREIALAYANAGADVAVLARSTDDLKKLAAEIEELGRRALVLTCDVGSPGQITRSAEEAISEFGRIDILVNNAAAVYPAGPFLDLTFDDWIRISRVNLDGFIQFCHAIGSHLVRQGSGSVINIASITGTTGFPFLSYYAATKAAVISLTQTLAAEWASAGVRVNALTPGWHMTEMTEGFLGNPDISEGIIRQIPLGRCGKAEEIAGAAVYLASEAAAYVTGSHLTMDGGQTAYAGGPEMIDLLKLGRVTST